MTCEKQQTKKYKLRNSPPYSAMDCKGKTMKGKDGTYVSKPDKNNRYKWVKQSSTTNSTKKNLEGVKPKHKYEIIDNGIIPYVVNDYGKRVEVYSNKYDETTNKAAIQGKILEIPYKKIFVGDNELNLKDYEKRGKRRGNSILLQNMNGKYTYIGDGIREFSAKAGDVIKEYYSPIGNNDVPYPYAVGEKFTYLLVDEVLYVNNDLLDLTKDVNEQYYLFSVPREELKTREKIVGKPLSSKTLSKRFALYR
jgi:hypothetical protein